MTPTTKRRRPGPTRARAIGVVGVLCSMFVVGACALSTDRQPRDVLIDERPTILNASSPVSVQSGTGSTVYFLGVAGQAAVSPLVAVGRSPKNDATALLTTLFEGPTQTEQATLGVRTAIPAGTVVLSTVLDSQGTLTVNLSTEFLSSAGDVLLDAVAQVVFTASQADGVRRVRLLVEGEPQDWPTSSGTTTRDPLSIYDFLDRLPSLTSLPNTTTTTINTTTTSTQP